MTNREEILWNHAIDNEDYELARQVAESKSDPEEQPPTVSNAVKEQRAILGAAAYWGVDYGSFRGLEP